MAMQISERLALGLFGFVLAAMFWPGQAGAAEVSRWAVVALGCPALLFLIKVRVTAVHCVSAAFLAWATLSIAWSTVFDDALNGWLQLVFLACAFVVGSSIASLMPLYRGLALGLAISSGVAVAQQITGEPLVSVMYNASAPPGLFVNPNVLGWSIAPVFVILLAQKTWIDAILALMILPGLIVSECRAAIGAAAICVIALLWLRNKYAAGGLAVVVALFVVSALPRYVDAASLDMRLDMWRDIVSGITPFGHGIGSFYATYPLFDHHLAHEAAYWIQLSHAHNDGLEVLFEFGFVGFGLLALLVTMALRRAELPERTGLVCIGIIALAGFPLYQPFTGCLAAFVAGHATRNWHRLRGTELHRRSQLYRRPQYAIFVPPVAGRPTLSAQPLLPV
jgi:O-antigen ligase